MAEEKEEEEVTKVAADSAIANVLMDVSLKIEGVAEWFTHLTDEEQARFLCAVEYYSRRFEKPACFQWDMMITVMREKGYDDAIGMLREWGEYATPPEA